MNNDTTDTTEAIQDQVIVGRALRELRIRSGITQDELATRIGIQATYVSRIERGHRGVRWHTVLRFLRALDTDLQQLINVINSQDQPSKS